LLAMFDSNGDGEMDFAEFEKVMTRFAPKTASPKARDYCAWSHASVAKRPMSRAEREEIDAGLKAIAHVKTFQQQVPTTSQEYGSAHAAPPAVHRLRHAQAGPPAGPLWMRHRQASPRPQSVNSGAIDWLVTHSGLQGHWDDSWKSHGDPGAGTMSHSYQAQAWGGQNLVRQERISERWYRNRAR